MTFYERLSYFLKFVHFVKLSNEAHIHSLLCLTFIKLVWLLIFEAAHIQENKTALDYAKIHGYKEVAALLGNKNMIYEISIVIELFII